MKGKVPEFYNIGDSNTPDQLRGFLLGRVLYGKGNIRQRKKTKKEFIIGQIKR